MIFQGRELNIGDVLESKRHGKIQVVTLKEHHFEANYDHGDRRKSGDWDYDGLYLCFESHGIDATWPASESVAQRSYDAIIKQAVDKFLGWKLPDGFCPDFGIIFDRVGNKGPQHEYIRKPLGTNLFDATQAEAMFRACVPCETPEPAIIAEATHNPEDAAERAKLREREYRKVWIDEAKAQYRYICTTLAFPVHDAPRIADIAFDIANAFIAELRARDAK